MFFQRSLSCAPGIPVPVDASPNLESTVEVEENTIVDENNTVEEKTSDSKKIGKMEKMSVTKKTFHMIFVGMIYFANEIAFSIEIALTIPILLKLKVSENLYSFVYFLSPLIGFLTQPIFGKLSDRCQLRLGRRRPFILVFSILAFIGIGCILNGYSLGQLMGDKSFSKPFIGISLVAIGVTLLDFSADSCDGPMRAYIIDTCDSKDTDLGLNIHATLAGVGSATGYLISAIPWNKTAFANKIDEDTLIFIIVAIIYILSLISTMIATKEKQVKRDKDEVKKSILTKIKELLVFLIKMPKVLARLFICQTIGWFAFFAVTFFFTDFVAQDIYKGNPDDPETAAIYDIGVKMGSWCLLVYSISSALFAPFLEKVLIPRLATKIIFLLSYILFSATCVVIFFLHNIWAIMFLTVSFGIFLTILNTLPYKLVYDFNEAIEPAEGADEFRGVGVDCSLLSSAFFLAQMLVALTLSSFISAFGNRVILIVAAVASALAFLFNLFFVIYPSKSASTDDIVITITNDNANSNNDNNKNDDNINNDDSNNNNNENTGNNNNEVCP